MALGAHTRSVIADETVRHQLAANLVREDRDGKEFDSSGRALAASLNWLPGAPTSDVFAERCEALSEAFKSLQLRQESLLGKKASRNAATPEEGLLWLRDNAQEFASASIQLFRDLGPLTRLPMVANREQIVPRVLAIAEGFIKQSGSSFSKPEFTSFCLAFEESTPLDYHEIGALVPALKLVLLERIAVLGEKVLDQTSEETSKEFTKWIRAYRHVARTTWKNELESLIPFDKILRKDPAAAYEGMDLESRNIYREKIARIAQRSARTEMEVAQKALSLAVKAKERQYGDPRVALRESHIGYYLTGEGSNLLCQRVGYHPRPGDRLRSFVRNHPDDILLVGIAVLTAIIITGMVWLLTWASTPLFLVLTSMLILVIPGSQAAVQLMNYFITNILPAEPLLKLDFSKGVRNDCVTLVAIPTLLLNESQVRRLIEQVEIRYLGNHDRNIHFAIVSDLPDSHEPAPEDDALVDLCSSLIEELNTRYAAKEAGSFFHLHRHRVYNPREKGWMGWERKRGKLLDLNQLLLGHYDAFPVKIGDLKVLSTVRYIITLDSDTELPRGSARRMVGTMAHPLNQAIIDPERNVVVAGYGILQPRVGISVQSTTRSRLAALFAGETGLDPYTRAISDVYQDLYGEGSFAGKGIYEVDTMFRVLQGRFPRNSLLSHDLIEGAYARAGLVTDIIVVEDYPSHYSAYNRRKHRWVRGDWQIMEWLLSSVPDESGARVPNPISLISKWKILDNLRRSLVDPATFALFIFAWFLTEHPVHWTIAAVGILFVPALVEFIVGLATAVLNLSAGAARNAFETLFDSSFTTLLGLTLLADQTLLSIDAIGRALFRRWVTRQRLLEWETAEEAEEGGRRTPIDRYIKWTPFLALVLGLLVWRIHPQALPGAIPVLLLWACSQPFAMWLNGLPIAQAPELDANDENFLRRSALHIWRYFHELSNEEHHWLVPDNIQGDPLRVTATVSPTNVGLLLNARQVAAELGYITQPEFADLTHKTLETLEQLQMYRGHLMNWYDTRTLQAKPPFFISSVDSGNMVASLWTLQAGCVDMLRRPLLSRSLAAGLLDHLRVLRRLKALPRKEWSRLSHELRGDDWLKTILNFPQEALQPQPSRKKSEADAAYFVSQTLARANQVQALVEQYLPWRLEEFAALRSKLFEGHRTSEGLALEKLPDLIAEVQLRLDAISQAAQNGTQSSTEKLALLLKQARENARQLVESLQSASRVAYRIAEAMDFTFLLDEQHMQLSVGFDAQSKELAPYFYDLLATEPRTAAFVSIAKEDIPQDCWFHLDRPTSTDHGKPVLLSWTGTMFEYMMPSVWMRSYPNTLLDRACQAAVRAQQAYGEGKGIPWGISESACARVNEAGDYHYEAFGVPTLARKKSESDPMIVSPYSTFLALPADRKAALVNLRKMESLGWFGSYGFIEAADYTNSRRWFILRRPELVRQWMVHHQGMSLLSLGNVLCNNVVQRWFHSNRRVQATEMLLQERPALELVSR